MSRLMIGKVQPEAYKAMLVLDGYVKATAVPPLQLEMIKIRASQVNGCGYCVDMHMTDAAKLGETTQRLNLMSVWRESGDVFTEEEKLILEMTEEVTLISKAGLSDRLYNQAIEGFGEERTAQIIMAIITINAWNRIGVAFQMHPPKR